MSTFRSNTLTRNSDGLINTNSQCPWGAAVEGIVFQHLFSEAMRLVLTGSRGRVFKAREIYIGQIDFSLYHSI